MSGGAERRAGTVPSTLYMGAISGTSVDGLDLALLDATARPPCILEAATLPLPPRLAEQLRALAAPGFNEVDRMARADAELGEFIGGSVRSMAQGRRIVAIGSHGQTIRHGPRATPAYTVQIGDPHRIAEVAGIDVVADFRRRDMAAGGEGAPLVPLFHEALFGAQDEARAILNIGGIANVTALGDGAEARGFDTGPGNALLDAWIQTRHGVDFDHDGAWAAQGTVLPRLLERLLQDPFLATAPPKSTGKEVYNLDYVRQRVAGDEDAADVQATLAEFTAATVAEAIGAWSPAASEVIACGGGRLNGDLVRRLKRRLAPRTMCLSDELGVNGDAIEAAAFAWLAHRFLAGLPGNAPAATGASGPRPLGALYAARLK